MTGEGFLSSQSDVNVNAVIGNMSIGQFISCLSAACPALFGGIGTAMNLENTTREEAVLPSEGVEKMASQHRETYTYTDERGVRQSIRLNGRNKQETDMKFQEYLGKAPTVGQRSEKTLREFILEEYRPTFTRNLAPTTLKSYVTYEEKYIFPNIGDKPLGKISVKDIQQLMDWLANGEKNGLQKNIVSGTIDRVKGHLATIFEIAKEMDYISDTPIKNKLLKNNGENSTHHKAMLPEEYADIRRKALGLTNERQRLYACLLAYTGMRIEEVLGLQWERINLQGGYCVVQEVVTYPDKSMPVFDPEPKSESSARTIILPPPVVEVLSTLARPNGFVLSAPNDPTQPLPYSTYQRLYRATFKALGIWGRYNNHDFRASYGTWLKESGVEISSAADLMGHKDTRMMSRVYAPTRHQSIINHQNLINSLVESQLVAPA